MAETFYVLDGHAQIYRAYYAPFRDLTSPSGEPTRATYVFCSMLINLLTQKKPAYCAMAIDLPDSTQCRRQIDPQYKANREPPPPDLLPQIDRIVQIVRAMNIPVLQQSGFEADDIMATLTARHRHDDLMIYLVSKDKDLEQLIGPNCTLYDPDKDVFIDADVLYQTKGYKPAQVIDIQTLSGDSIDNIPGVKGIGSKTAIRLIQQYGSAEAVLNHADQLTPKMRENVRDFSDKLSLTRQLVTLRKDVPISFDLKTARFEGIPIASLRPIFLELGFTRLLQNLDHLKPEFRSASQVPESVPELFPSESSHHYEMVNTPADLKKLAQNLSKQKAFAFDTETTGLDPMSCPIVGLSICWQKGHACYIPICSPIGDTVPPATVAEVLKPIFESSKILKCGHNIKFDMLVLRQIGIEVAEPLFDSMVAGFLLNPLRNSNSLDHLAMELFSHTMIPITDLIGKGKNQITMDQVDSARVCEYASEDADFTWRLYESFALQIASSTLEPLFEKTEMPLIPVLTDMEHYGVAIDVPFLEQMSRKLDDRLQTLTQNIYDAAGHPFNIDSTRQLAEVLFDELKLRVIRKTKTGRSTDAETLSTLSYETSHPLPALVLEYRELTKLKSTYVDNLPTMINPKTQRIHARFNMISTVTGRLSSNDPNLQNIPIRTEIGRQIRRAFIPGDPDHVLLTADYSQIELRVLAHFCQDETLIDAFRKDQDIHAFVASQIFGVPLKDVTSEQRNRAKSVNFGIIYGQTAYGLSRTTGLAVGEAQRFIDLYFLRYPGIRSFIDRCVDQVRRDGFATTLLGRRRPITDLQAVQRTLREQGERLAINTVIQGSAADLIKQAMIRIHRRLRSSRNPAKMLIQVHDELVFEVPRNHAKSEAEQICSDMTEALILDVPLKVDVNWGPNWLESKKS